MIKLIVLDLVDVLVTKREIKLTKEEEKLEKMFGNNVDDSTYLIEGRKIFDKDSILMRTTEELINKLYQAKDEKILEKIKLKYNWAKIIIATNHVSFIRNFIGETFGVEYLDDVLISAEIHKVKPNLDFYEYIINKYHLKPEEILILENNINNIAVTRKLGLNTIEINKDTNIYDSIIAYIEKI